MTEESKGDANKGGKGASAAPNVNRAESPSTTSSSASEGSSGRVLTIDEISTINEVSRVLNEGTENEERIAILAGTDNPVSEEQFNAFTDDDGKLPYPLVEKGGES